MLKIRNGKVKLFGIITCTISFCISYLGLTFYSIPEKASAVETTTETRSLSDITYMQEMNIDICTNSKKYESKALKDTRGGGFTNGDITNSYMVTKLDDGNCWMTQNLSLNNINITTSDSNVEADYFIPYPTSSGWENDNAMLEQTFSRTNPTAARKFDGTFYSWCAAVAGSCKNVEDNQVDYSVCPKGWILPAAGESKRTSTSYHNLIIRAGLFTDQGALKIQDKPYNFVAAGIMSNGVINFGDVNGYYWTSSTPSDFSDDTRADILVFGKKDVFVSNTYRGGGVPVRCVSEGIPYEGDTGLTVLVNPYLTIEATSGMTETMGAENILHGNISATVAANGEYNVMLSAEQPDLKDPSNTDFPGIPASSNVIANNNAWGIQNRDATTYKAVTTTAQIFDSVDTINETLKSTTHTYTVGVSASPSIPAGKYSTTVTVTAVGN